MGHGSAVLGAGTYVEAERFCFGRRNNVLIDPHWIQGYKRKYSKVGNGDHDDDRYITPFASACNKKSPLLAKNDFFCISLSVWHVVTSLLHVSDEKWSIFVSVCLLGIFYPHFPLKHQDKDWVICVLWWYIMRNRIQLWTALITGFSTYMRYIL